MRKWISRFCFWFRRPQFERHMDVEIRHHLEKQTERNVQAGMSPAEAAYAAQRQFGNVACIQEQARETRGWVWLEHWVRDFRFSLRALRRSMGFSLAVIATLALCIGANTTVISVLYGLILKPMPFQDAGQLVQIFNALPKSNRPRERVSIPQYLEYKASADLFAGFALWSVWSFNIGEENDPERGVGARASADYFELLGVQPLLGRFYTMEECVPGKDTVLVLTETFWERKFNADPTVIGRVVRLSGQQFTIIGVAPRSIEAFNSEASLLKPLEWSPTQAVPRARWRPTCTLYGRIKPGVAHSMARAQLMTLEQRAQATAPPAMQRVLEEGAFQTVVIPVRAEQTRTVRTSLLLLQGGALFVLLLGCVNVANLMLARANARKTELAVRQALGAGPGALVRQMAIEGLMLAIAGAAVGLILAWGSLRVINIYTAAIVREIAPVTLDGAVLAVTLLTAVLVALLIAVLPALTAWRTNLLVSLQGGSRGASANGLSRAASGSLVVVQVALALVLLIGASLLIRSFSRVLKVNPGFDVSRVVQGRTVFGFPGMTPEAVKSTYDLIIARMKEIPGVEKVGCTGGFPLSPTINLTAIPLRGSIPGQPETQAIAAGLNVSPEFFEAMGISLLEGRYFNDADTMVLPRRAYIVDENFARRYFPGRSAIGEAFGFGPASLPPGEWPRIVGVVASSKLFGLEDTTNTPVSFSVMGPAAGFSMVLRTSHPAGEIMPLMRAKLRSVDPAAPLYHEGALQDELDYMLSNRRGVMWLLGAFAGIALLLSAVGVYGMLAYDVVQRTREIGIRGAIGATRGQIVRLVLRQGMTRTAAGAAVGVVAAFFLSRYLETLLFEITGRDPLTFIGAIAGLTLIALLACWLPAHRAAKVDPVVALRAE